MPDSGISRFQILEKLGEGGMGVVYRARDLRLQRIVAVKQLPRDNFRDPALRQRFLREARAASALNHPRIVTVHDILELEDDAYLVMELIEGRTLGEMIPKGGMALSRALRYAAQIAGAIAAAHAAGIVHRDLKPSNVMVTLEDEVKVLDFGLAKSLHPDPVEGEDLDLTREGTLLGTASYMSPEQALGEAVDARTDVFSFGVVLYQMLTGELPFEPASGRSVSRQIVSAEPMPLRERRAELPGALESLVGRALAKDREDRPESLGPIATELEAMAARYPAAGGRPLDEAQTLQMPAARPRPRSRWLPVGAALAVVVAGLLLALGLRQWLGGRADDKPAPAIDAAAGDAGYRLFQQGLEELRHYERPENIERAVEAFQGAIAGDPDYAAAHAGLARAYWRKYRATKEQAWLDLAIEHAEHARDLDPQLTLALVNLGLIHIERGGLDAAEAELDRALRLDPANADAQRGLGDLRRRRGDSAGAEQAYLRAVELAPENNELHGVLGSLYYQGGRYEEAAAAFRRSVQLAPERFTGYKNLAAALHMLGRYAEAAQQLQTALQIRPDPKVYSNLGTLYFFQGLYTEAVTAFERAVELVANDHLLWGNLGDAYRWAPGERQKAGAAYDRAVELLEPRLARAPEDPQLKSRLALYLAKAGDAERCTALLDGLDGESLTANDLYRVAVAREIAGDRPRALETLGRALAAGYSRVEVESDPELAELRQDPGYPHVQTRGAQGGASL